MRQRYKSLLTENSQKSALVYKIGGRKRLSLCLCFKSKNVFRFCGSMKLIDTGNCPPAPKSLQQIRWCVLPNGSVLTLHWNDASETGFSISVEQEKKPCHWGFPRSQQSKSVVSLRQHITWSVEGQLCPWHCRVSFPVTSDLHPFKSQCLLI